MTIISSQDFSKEETQLEAENQQAVTDYSTLAFGIAIFSWGMLFVTLFLGYFVYRFSQPIWPPLGIAKFSILYPILSTGSILLSSVLLIFARLKLLNRKISFPERMSQALKFVVLSFFLGLGYLVFQKLLLLQLDNLQIYAGTNIFSSIIYGFTWIHAGHLLLGLFALLFLIFRLNKLTEQTEVNFMKRSFKSIEYFWHFLGMVWLLMFLMLFIF